MNSIETLRRAIEISTHIFTALAEDVKSDPMARATEGGNHAAWCVGHMAWGDHALLQTMFGEPNPLEDWKPLFNAGTQPSDDASIYPPYDELLEAFQASRAQILKRLTSLSEADLDQPSANPPDNPESPFATVGGCMIAASLHPMHHRGQLADIRRALSREPMLA